MLSHASHAWLVDREDNVLNEHFNKRDMDGDEDKPVKITAKELQALYKHARTQYEAELEALGVIADFSDDKKWVSYSDDKQIRRTVDFEENEIQLSVPRMERDGRVDFSAVNALALSEVEDLLNTTIKEALEEDPLFEVWESIAELEGRNKIEGDEELNRTLVFSELFSTALPSTRMIQRVAGELMERSYIAYQTPQSSTVISRVDVPIAVDRVDFRVPLPDDRLLKKAKNLRPIVSESSKEHNVPVHVIFAVIHTESFFNPLARSRIPAYGLMQVVPRTAGRDVSQLLYKDQRLKLTSSYLYDPKNNVNVGTAYLRVLYYRYLKKITNPQSRLYCTIAAYNTGTVNVARAFVNMPSMQEAIPVINNMSSEQVLDRLMKKLPAKESRDYLKKILERSPGYSHFDLPVDVNEGGG